ncbi:MAG: metal ABC transporter substrate-binding protein [Lachnospiraceae bacterium]|nr:metal ABC transporter substrate-binding protein [Lachnospiraceae bacterium]
MKKLNKVILFVVTVVLSVTALSACKKKENSTKVFADKISVVATIFPEYDFLRQIGGEHINLTMLLPPGAESHSFEPTPQDIKAITKSNMFVYVGGDSDAWVDSILDSIDTKNTKVVTLMDCVSLVEEKTVDGMTPEEKDGEDSDEVEYDEHVWTSPKNTILIVQKLCDNLCQIDQDNAGDYKQNTKDYIDKLTNLDQKFQNVVDNAKRKEIVVGDRFPFRYFVDEYGLTYYAAFPGCSTDTEASAATIAFLDDKINKDNIPIVFHIELSNEKVCDAICEATGAKSELLNAVHNVSKSDFNAGITYIDLMEHNVEVLKEALN